MKIYTWNDILAILNGDSNENFPKTGISTGCFDGLHKGHRKLLSALIDACRAKGLSAGVVTFARPLPGIKHSNDYKGDLTTLNQRLNLFEQLGIDFAIIVDFDDSFASMMGADYLNILLNVCNMELLAEGIDFRCGFKGATDAQAIRYWAEKNNVETIFVDPVYFKEGTDEEERISSSYIRTMLSRGFFTTACELLERPYEIDIAALRRDPQSAQLLPPDGLYRTENEKGELVRLKIENGRIKELPVCERVRFI
ncbi:riboflavin kinase / FMN adenylyltransferase [Treponema bryantii]|uniref:FAD synthase n=1 Tax=Treponema bryantii TaxID=163 RepID=A0A1I3K2T5_9SPIR|nr:FAD synthetase family protein [Treponema bryantii]SFI66630.1 riboflavin kinase / FMN adenylyltransferase [Treponema bryantii]